jgi:fructokinase
VSGIPVLSIGELLWDVFPDGERLGGAPFNFAAHMRRLGHAVIFLSAVGDDPRGSAARERATQLGLPPDFIQIAPGQPTGIVTVQLDAAGQPTFTIHRPAAYDAVRLSADDLSRISTFAPAWICFGTLHQTDPRVLAQLRLLIEKNPQARRFYDINLRRDCYTPALVDDLLHQADVVKLNEDEMIEIDRLRGRAHASIEQFCRQWSAEYGWSAVCVTRGARGGAALVGGEYAEAEGCPVKVVDAVGAGDAFAAAFLHGLSEGWPAARVVAFANRLGALVASRPGAVPPWSIEELETFSAEFR